jgi:hypothetical protein
VQTYNYANLNSIAVIFSDDEGKSWPHRLVLQTSEDYFQAPGIASDGDMIAVSWLFDKQGWIMVSPDGGKSWSQPGKFNQPEQPPGLFAPVVAVSGNKVGILYGFEGVQFCFGEV